MKRAKMKVIIPHADDELWVISMILNFVGDIGISVLTEGDFISEGSYNVNKKNFELVCRKICDYRENKKLGQYNVDYFAEYGDVDRDGISKDAQNRIFKSLESSLKENEFEYLVYLSESIHPSHFQCRRIVEGLFRTPYLFNIKTILMGLSAQEYFFQTQDAIETAFCPIKNEDVPFIKELHEIYANKCGDNFRWEMIESGFRSAGVKIKSEYAQGFVLRRTTIL